MRNKKLLSTVVASALVATTMTVPVMAAEGGSLDVGVTTKTAVIRVQVPTTMSIAVNQFEMGDGGSQIYSSAFSMENKSEIPVKVNVTSTAELASTTKLLASKDAAAASTTEGEAWLAVAAQTASGAYGADVADLSDSSKNVASFVQGADTDATKGTASQTFYLNKSDNMAFKLLNAGQDASEIEYAQFYQLEAKTLANQTALDALLETDDVYVATAAAANDQALTKVEKGGTHTYSASEVYYTAAFEATAKDSINASNLYVYGDGSTDTAGSAAFRYIGKLSGAQESWTKDDISKVTIKYDVVGVQESKYATEAANCTYGLYTPADSYVMSADNGALTYTFTNKPSGEVTAITAGSINLLPAYSNNNVTYDATTGVFTIKAAVVTAQKLSDGATVKVTIGGTEYTLTYTK